MLGIHFFDSCEEQKTRIHVCVCVGVSPARAGPALKSLFTTGGGGGRRRLALAQNTLDYTHARPAHYEQCRERVRRN